MRIVAGCDGGGTKCEVHVAQIDCDGQTIRSGAATAGSANVRTSSVTAEKSVLSATRAAMIDAGLTEDTPIDAFAAGLAGAGTDELRREWEGKLADRLRIRKIRVCTDAELLFAAAEVSGQGVATIVGTGSIAWARDGQGNLSRDGGLGPRDGDEGSAYWIGHEAVRRTLPSYTPSPLGSALLKQLGVSSSATELSSGSLDASDRISILNDATKLASLAPTVFEAAKDDPIALAVLTDAADHISSMNTAACRKLKLIGPLDWICGGGVAVHQRAWLDTIRARCLLNGLQLTPPVIIKQPAVGAVELAKAIEAKRS